MLKVNWGSCYEVQKTVRDDVQEGGGPAPTDMFKPQTRNEIIGNLESRTEIKKWFDMALSSKRPQNTCCLLIVHSSAPGTGKTSTIDVEAKTRNIRLTRLDGQEARTASAIESAVRKSISENLILFLEDAHRLVEEITGLAALLRLLKADSRGEIRVCCCVDEIEDVRLRPLMSVPGATLVKMEPVPYAAAIPHLQRCAKKKSADLGYFDAMLIAQRSGGDIRSMHIELGMALRTIVKKGKYKGQVKILGGSLGEATSLPSARTSVNCIVKGMTSMRHNVCTAAHQDGAEFSRILLKDSFPLWPLHRTWDQGIDTIAEAYSDGDILLREDIGEEGWREDGLGLGSTPLKESSKEVSNAERAYCAAALVTHALCDGGQTENGRAPQKRVRKVMKYDK